MSPLRLSKSSLTIDFEVHENGNSSEQRLKFAVDRVEREVNNPHPVTLQKAILGMQSFNLPNGQKGYKLFRKISEVPFPFDADPALARGKGQIKVTYHLRDDVSGQEFRPAVTYPIEIDSTFDIGSDLQAVPLLAVLTLEGAGAMSRHKLVFVTDGGGPATPECSGCFDDPSPKKRRECAAVPCYFSS
jgi:hypothetical protein